MKTEPNEPISPIVISNFDHERCALFIDDKFQGLTKREYFAALSMQGQCANSIPGNHHAFDNVAKEAVMYADALINELNKQQP